MDSRDHTTLATMLDRLSERAGLKKGATIVIDRGMAYDENIAELRKRNLHYVVASRQPERDRWLADFEDTDGFTPVLRQPSPLNPAQKKSTIEVKTRTDDKQTYVLCRSEQRIAKDRAIRAKHEERLRAEIDKLTQRIANGRLVNVAKINQAIGRLKERYPRVARYFNLTYDQGALNAEFDADKHLHAQRLDGCYLLKTSRKDLSGDELWRIYILLTRAENAFRDMKSPLAERPIWHHLERRVDTHISLCVLAYHLLISIEKTLLDNGVHTSWATIRDILKTHQICTIVLPTDDGACLRILKAATPDPDVQELYRHLNISPDIIKPQHTWAQHDSD
jgi:transposase